jgi:hypothetical protein
MRYRLLLGSVLLFSLALATGGCTGQGETKLPENPVGFTKDTKGSGTKPPDTPIPPPPPAGGK